MRATVFWTLWACSIFFFNPGSLENPLWIVPSIIPCPVTPLLLVGLLAHGIKSLQSPPVRSPLSYDSYSNPGERRLIHTSSEASESRRPNTLRAHRCLQLDSVAVIDREKKVCHVYHPNIMAIFALLDSLIMIWTQNLKIIEQTLFCCTQVVNHFIQNGSSPTCFPKFTHFTWCAVFILLASCNWTHFAYKDRIWPVHLHLMAKL